MTKSRLKVKQVGVRMSADLRDRLYVEAERLSKKTGLDVSIQDVMRKLIADGLTKTGA